MTVSLALAPWALLLLLGIAAMQWGAAQVSELLDAFRRRWRLAETACGALVGLATAIPEISVNLAAVALGWPDIGLGTALGSNVPALPLIFLISLVSTWRHRGAVRQEAGAAEEGPRVKEQAVWVQAVPYLAAVLLLALLTLPPRWRGLQPIDGALLFLAWLLYFARALLQRDRGHAAAEPLRREPLLRTAAGLLAICAGALASVFATRHVNDALGISDLVGGLFITGFLCALPESFAAWRLSRDGNATAAVSSAMADGTVSITIAFIPLALAGTDVGQLGLYAVNLAYLAGALLAFMALNRPGRGQRLTPARVGAFLAGYACYIAAVLAVG